MDFYTSTQKDDFIQKEKDDDLTYLEEPPPNSIGMNGDITTNDDEVIQELSTNVTNIEKDPIEAFQQA